MSARKFWLDLYSELATSTHAHAHGSFANDSLRQIEELLPAEVENTVETGCGKSTILFSNISRHHKAFAVEDRSMGPKIPLFGSSKTVL